MRDLKACVVVTLLIACGTPNRTPPVQNPMMAAGPVSNVSASCAVRNAEVEQAVDPARNTVYEEWIGCGGIGFARSTDGGVTFGKAVALPGTTGSKTHVWDPAVAVAPDGTVYAAYMILSGGDSYPVVAVSTDHGSTFVRSSALQPPEHMNWGDRDFIAVAPDGTVYVTWDYAPDWRSVRIKCPGGSESCSFIGGTFNEVIQSSSDRGATWSPQYHISPGFPNGAADSAPLVVEPDGRLDVVFQGYRASSTSSELEFAYNFFTSSSDGGKTWSPSVRIGPANLTMPAGEWWIDGDVAIDGGGILYATWDTRDASTDTAWLSYSSDHGTSWSTPVQASGDQLRIPHIVEAAGGQAGTVFVGWLSPRTSSGYELDVRVFNITQGWLLDPFRVSIDFGNPSIWPGDTFGLSTLGADRLLVSWGGAPAGQKDSRIYARPVAVARLGG
jgi:hypothetical protein